MKILFLNHNVAWKGGTFFRALPVSRQLVQLGHDVTLITISPDRRWRWETKSIDGVQVVMMPDLFWGSGRSGWDPWDIINRFVYLRNSHWDIIHAWDCRPAVILPAIQAHRLSRSRGGKLFIDWCDWWGRGGIQAERPASPLKSLYHPVETFFEESFRTRADGTTVISRALFERVVKLGVRPERVRIVPQGCDVAPETGESGRRAARRRLNIRASTPLVVFIGTMLPAEGNLLFASVRFLLKTESDCTVVLVGNLRVPVPEDIRAMQQVVLTGFVPEQTLNDYIVAADVLLSPLTDSIASRARWTSRVNPFLSSGKAVVVTRVGDLAALLESEAAGMVVDPSAEHIARAVVAILADRDLKTRLERNAHRVAGNVLAWPRIVQGIEKFYREIHGHGGAPHGLPSARTQVE